MKSLANTLTALILAGWICIAAIVAVQNFTPVSFTVLTVRSIEIPLGVVLALSAAGGAIAATLIPLLVGTITRSPEDRDR